MVGKVYDKDTGRAINSSKHFKGMKLWDLIHFERYCQENIFTTICCYQKLVRYEQLLLNYSQWINELHLEFEFKIIIKKTNKQ